jgi:hypothetical protein
MIQTLADSQQHLTSKCDRPILCCYINITPQLQLIRIPNIPNLHLERVVFPGQRLMFETVPEAQLEIRSSDNITLVVPCQNLRVTEILAKENTPI